MPFFKKFRIKRKLIARLAKWHFFGNPSAKLKVVGVTGTNGKTTTATLLYRVASALGHKAGLISTVENMIGDEKNTVPHDQKNPGTTPGPIYLNKLLSRMAQEGCEYAFMEVSSHALDQDRVAGIKFAGGIFTNLTHDHLDYHKNFEDYFRAKKKFFEMLPENAFALSNVDDECGDAMLDGIRAEKFFYGFGEETEVLDFYGRILKLDFSGLELDFNGEKVKSKLLGKFNAYNLLAVWGAAKLLNFDVRKVNPVRSKTPKASADAFAHRTSNGVNKILEDVRPPRGRFDHFMSPNGVLVVVDYAHTPDALQKILLAVREIGSSGPPAQAGRIISVFGCGGDRDPLKRPKMGKIGASLSDIAIFTSDNPRSEVPDRIIEEMKADLSHEEMKKIITIADRRLAIREAVEMARAGDIILCAGKGHEDYQEVKGVRNRLDDMEELKKAFH